MKTRIFAIMATLAVVLLSACQPPPQPGTIDILGDSLTVQATWDHNAEFDARGRPPDSDVVLDAWGGFQFQDVQQRQGERVASGRPEIMVIVLGTNNAEAWTGHWQQNDVDAYVQLLNTPHSDTCVVVVLPGFSYKPTLTAADHTSVDAARRHMTTYAEQRPNTIIADWGSVARSRPELTDYDGVHLANTTAARNAYADVIWGGVNSCPS